MRVIDSHTGGEPTRVVIEGAPALGGGPVVQRAERFAREAGDFRSAVLNEPRGYDAMVGALLCEPDAADCVTGVIFFNRSGNLGMCGHATIGTAITLAHLGRIGAGVHRFETPVGIVSVELKSAHEAALENVASYRYRRNVCVRVDGLGSVSGDIAWGGNWFFLSANAPCDLTAENIAPLSKAAADIRRALTEQDITGADGAVIDHIQFFGVAQQPDADSRNFVLCSSGAYDRSPCGTGTSARLACLAADDRLQPGVIWTQESTIGSRFQASYRPGADGRIIPNITSRAYLCADTRLIRDPADPYADGIKPGLVQSPNASVTRSARSSPVMAVSERNHAI
jgi:4-hydroxyproline epimerase